MLVLLSPKHPYLRSSDRIRCISAGMIAPISFRAENTYTPSPSLPLSSIVSLCVHTAPLLLVLISIKMPLLLDSHLRINQRIFVPVAHNVERPV